MSTSKSKPSISSTNSQKSTKQQLINTINSILSLDVNDDEFNKFMNECKERVKKSNENENELIEILNELLFKHKIHTNYPLLIWLIEIDAFKNESIVLQIIQKYSKVLSSFLKETDTKNNENLLMFSVQRNCISINRIYY